MIERRLAAAHVFVRDIQHPELDDFDAHHLLRVLRVRAGETVTVSDGRGSWRACAMTSSHCLEPESAEIHIEAPSARSITVAFGITKADKPETVVQKLTEIGVDHIAPVLLERSVVRWDQDKVDRQHDRFLRVVREGAMQSRQVFLPTVHRIAPNLKDLMKGSLMVGQLGSVAGAEPGGEPLVDDLTAIVIGPEGGFSTAELEQFERTVALPGGILRAETAAIAAGVLLAHARALS